MAGKDRQVYTPDGELVTLHDHNWVMDSVTMHPQPDIAKPLAGCTVLWRCTRRNCQGLRETKYNFRKPRANQLANQFSAKVDTILIGMGKE